MNENLVQNEFLSALLTGFFGCVGEIITHFYEHRSLCVVFGYAAYNVGGFCTRVNYGARK
jgi:hypothetical protein